MNTRWEHSSPPKGPSKQSLIKERLAEEKELVAEEHRRLRTEFYERTAPKWGLTEGAT